MTEIINKKLIGGDLALIEDLERRYGPGMAQEIMDQIKKAENKSGTKTTPNYIGVKALSEGAEIYRREAKAALQRLKSWKSSHDGGRHDVIDWDGAFLKSQFERTYSFYLRFNQSFHILYRQGIEAYRVKGTYPYKEIRTDQTEQRTIGQAA